jgi:HNH endonuclease
MFVKAQPAVFVRVASARGRRGCTNVPLKSARKPKIRRALEAAWRLAVPSSLSSDFFSIANRGFAPVQPWHRLRSVLRFGAQIVEIAVSLPHQTISALEDSMPISLTSLSIVDSPVTREEGRKILERDNHVCQYCGLDGRASFENALVMRVDFVVPRARKGKKDPSNLVACCTPCNTIKGTRVYASFDEAKAFVLAQRDQLRKSWESKIARPLAKAAKA